MEYLLAVERGLMGLEAVSTGVCPGCEVCAEEHDVSLDELRCRYENGEIVSEPHFSNRGCDICGTMLGGDREVWHAIKGDELIHGSNCCVDCVCYLANGDVPEAWSYS